MPIRRLRGDLTETAESRAGGGGGRGAVTCVRNESPFLCAQPNSEVGKVALGYPRVENSREGVGAAGHGLAAAVAVPDAPGLTANGVAAAEGAGAEG